MSKGESTVTITGNVEQTNTPHPAGLLSDAALHAACVAVHAAFQAFAKEEGDNDHEWSFEECGTRQKADIVQRVRHFFMRGVAIVLRHGYVYDTGPRGLRPAAWEGKADPLMRHGILDNVARAVAYAVNGRRFAVCAQKATATETAAQATKAAKSAAVLPAPHVKGNALYTARVSDDVIARIAEVLYTLWRLNVLAYGTSAEPRWDLLSSEASAAIGARVRSAIEGGNAVQCPMTYEDTGVPSELRIPDTDYAENAAEILAHRTAHPFFRITYADGTQEMIVGQVRQIDMLPSGVSAKKKGSKK